MNKLRAGFVGLGMGRHHGKLMAASGRYEVVAFCDPDDRRLAEVQAENPNARYYRSQAEMLKAEQLDVVAQAVPHNLHLPLAVESLEAGVHTITEKPFATNYFDCLRMIEAAKKAGKVLTVYHNRRLDPWLLAAKELVASGALGEVFQLDSAIGYSKASPTWRSDKKASGGVMFDWGAHLVDYTINILNKHPIKVSGHFYRAKETTAERNHDHGTLRMYFEGGAIANITISAREFITPMRYRIMGTLGTYVDKWNWRAEDSGELYTANPDGTHNPYSKTIPYIKPPTEYYINLADHLQNGEPLLVQPETAAEVIRILETAEVSHESGGAPIALI